MGPCHRERRSVDQRGLVVRARGGDHDAFTMLVDLTVARLDSAARLILRDPELARDAVQESLIRAWRDLPGLRTHPDRFDAWLHRLMVHWRAARGDPTSIRSAVPTLARRPKPVGGAIAYAGQRCSASVPM